MAVKTIVETERVGYEGAYALIVPDHAAGRAKRFTVYRIPGAPSRHVRVIGRELPLGHAKRVAANLPRARSRRSEACSLCHGAGLVGSSTCSRCGGSGEGKVG